VGTVPLSWHRYSKLIDCISGDKKCQGSREPEAKVIIIISCFVETRERTYYLNEDSYFAKMIDAGTILGLISKDKETAVKEFEEYMNKDSGESFIDLKEEAEVIDEDVAVEIYEKMLIEQKLERDEVKIQQIESVIMEFREKTNLSIRKIAAITDLNKDKVNKMLSS
jgi:putative transposase